MKKLMLFTALLGTMCALQSCVRTGNDVWEDTKSAGRHMQRGVRSLGGKQGHSRQISSRDDFECMDDMYLYDEVNPCPMRGQEGPRFQDYHDQDGGYEASEFIPLQDSENELAMANSIVPQPRQSPGEPGSSIPSIEFFKDPALIPQLAGIFRNIYFDYNSSLIKGQQNLQIIHNIADLMKRQRSLYIFIEGHTDERGPQAYNLALGSRRANAVRNLLISEGVNPDQLFTISYGKERPVILERHEEGWAKNRRAEFKIYER
jgi:peptidoglycan-associated lipoprotein